MSMTPFDLDRRAILLGVAASALAACAPRGAEGPVRIGYQRGGVLLLAKARGQLPAALQPVAPGVEWVEFAAGPPLMEAMAAGSIDFGAVGDAPPIFAQAAKAPIVYVAVQPVTGAGSALLLPPGSSVRTVAELKGRKVAFTKGTSAHLFIYHALKQAGLSLADVQPAYLSPGDAAGAFGSGALDAWATWDPYYALAVRDQRARPLVTGESLPKTNAFYIASHRFAETRPQVLKALLDGLRVEAQWGMAHVAEVAGVVGQATGLPSDIAQAALRRGAFAVDPVDDAALAAQQASADAFLDIGAIPAAVDVRAAAWRDWTPRG
ncbi:MAG: sulfonate ABC transporter substrate-binding protein [Phenylobacterium zucineum]|nr:MAG: sulfonate ABC transporter substrate-binding protein [Phenylobacterium zucineum]